MGSYEFLDFQTQAGGVGGEALTQYSDFSSFDGLPSTQDGAGAEGGGIMSGLNGAVQNGVSGGVAGGPSVPASAAPFPGAAAAGNAAGAAGSASGAANGSAGAGVEGLSAALSEMSFDEAADDDAGEYQSAEAPEHACR